MRISSRLSLHKFFQDICCRLITREVKLLFQGACTSSSRLVQNVAAGARLIRTRQHRQIIPVIQVCLCPVPHLDLSNIRPSGVVRPLLLHPTLPNLPSLSCANKLCESSLQRGQLLNSHSLSKRRAQGICQQKATRTQKQMTKPRYGTLTTK